MQLSKQNGGLWFRWGQCWSVKRKSTIREICETFQLDILGWDIEDILGVESPFLLEVEAEIVRQEEIDLGSQWSGEWVWLWDGDCRVVVRPPQITLRSANQQPPPPTFQLFLLFDKNLSSSLPQKLEMFCPLITEWNLQDGSHVAPVGGELGEPLHVGLPLLLPLPVHLQVELGQADRRLLEQRAHHRASGHPSWCAGENIWERLS